VSRRLLGLCGCGGVLLALTVTGLYAQREHGIDGFVVVALAQGAVYALASWLVRRGVRSRHAAAIIIGLAAAMRAVVVLAPPYLSSDIYRYVWDGRVMAAGINPYRYVPNDPHLAALRDTDIFPEINRGNYARTIYPPAAQAIFFVVTRLGESLTVMKLAMIGFEAIAIVLMLRLLRAAGRPAAWIAVYAWHPLPLWEFAGSGHIDAAMIAFVALALWSRRPWLTGLALAGGTLVKLYPAVLLPALWHRWDWRMPALFCLALVAAYLPFAGAGARVLGFLPDYAAEEGFAGGAGFYWWSLARSVLPIGGPGGINLLGHPDVRGLLFVSRDVHDHSKTTTLPIAREIVATYLRDDTKLPWYIDLLNINLDNHDVAEAKRRIRLLLEAFRKDGTRITENLDFA